MKKIKKKKFPKNPEEAQRMGKIRFERRATKKRTYKTDGNKSLKEFKWKLKDGNVENVERNMFILDGL